jgi:hypothetical protein
MEVSPNLAVQLFHSFRELLKAQFAVLILIHLLEQGL